VGGTCVFLNGVSIEEKSKMQNDTKLSVTEAEAAAAVPCAQGMLFALNLLESIGLKVKKPMLLYCDNQGAVDLFNGWSVAGRTRHVSTKINWMRELKEQGLLEVRWVRSADNCSDLYTKNLGGDVYDKHAQKFVGWDKYFNDGSKTLDKLQGESVGGLGMLETVKDLEGVPGKGKESQGTEKNPMESQTHMGLIQTHMDDPGGSWKGEPKSG
jgi:hypothetical protein